jgi:hypothetical protein
VTVTEGFVESEPGTRFVGRRLFADRVLRALQSGAPDMHLQVHVGPRTERFHAEIYRIVGGEASHGGAIGTRSPRGR